MASVTGWTRLEPRPRSGDFATGLEARVHDPLWLLARQWQVGEFRGDDAGSLVAARLEVGVTPINRYQPGPDGTARPYDLRRLPLEALVERERVRPADDIDVRLAAEAGLHFLRLLRLRDADLEDRYRPGYTERYPLAAGDTVDPASRRFLAVMAGRAPDGAALETDLRTALAAEPPSLPAEPVIEAGDIDALLDVARDWLAWWDELFLEPREDEDEDAWVPERLEYRFRVSAPEGDSQIVLAAGEYRTGDLDWFDFDVVTDAALDAEPGPGEMQTVVHTVVPTAVEFAGMPAPRWWEFEQGRVDFGRIDAAADDLARLLLLEFALVYGNDWLMIPVTIHAGSICRVLSLEVTDTFGVRLEIPASAEGDTGSWGLFYLAESGRPLTHRADPAGRVLFLPPTPASSLTSDPVEDVLLVRDEMANMAWAIERTVPGADGRPLDRFEAYQEKRRAEPPPGPLAEDAAVQYRLASTIPDHWIPLVPVHTGADSRAIALQRGAMLDPGIGQAILPLGRILTPGRRLIFPDETVSRAGERVTRHFQHARWTDGSSLLWMGRRRRPGRGEGSSGLRFDSVTESG